MVSISSIVVMAGRLNGECLSLGSCFDELKVFRAWERVPMEVHDVDVRKEEDGEC